MAFFNLMSTKTIKCIVCAKKIVEKYNDLILLVFLGSLYGRMAIDDSWKCVKISHILKSESCYFYLPCVVYKACLIFSLVMPCMVISLTTGGLGYSGYRHKHFGLMHSH